MPLDTNFWSSDYTEILDECIEGRLYLEVFMGREKKWPDIWTPEEVWFDPDFHGLCIRHFGFMYSRPVGYNFLTVRREHNPEQYIVGGGWSPFKFKHEPGHTFIENSSSWGRRTEPTEDDLTFLFSQWNPTTKRLGTFSEWLEHVRKHLPSRGLHADDIAMIGDAARGRS